MAVCSGYSSGRSTSPDDECHGNCSCSIPLAALPPDTVYAFIPCSKNAFLATTPIYDCTCPCRKTYAIDWRIPPIFSRGAHIFQLVDIRELYLDVMAENRLLKTERFDLTDEIVRLQKKMASVETLLHGWNDNRLETENMLEKAFEQLKQDDDEQEYNEDSLPGYVSDTEDTEIRPSTSGVTFQKKNKKRKKKNKKK